MARAELAEAMFTSGSASQAGLATFYLGVLAHANR